MASGSPVRVTSMVYVVNVFTNMEMSESLNGDLMDSDVEDDEKPVKKKKPGIIYLSTLPPFMNVTKTKEIFGAHGEIGRIFLQPATFEEKKQQKKKKKPAIHFSEGWIEFVSKKVAKEVANNMNNTQIGGKKKSKFYDYIWNIKYLPGFKWAHLSERLAYERAVRRQKLRAEIAQAKREANFFSANLDKSKKLKKKEAEMTENINLYPQRETDREITSKKKKMKSDTAGDGDRTEFLKSIFSGA